MATPSSSAGCRRLRCDATAPGLARREAHRVTRGRSGCDDVVLVASELVTNAVRHSGCDERDEIELQIEQASDGVVITVRDVGRSASQPAARQASPARKGLAAGGLGLQLVEMLSTRWGTGAVDGRLVWAHIAC